MEEKKLPSSPSLARIAAVIPCYKVRQHILGVVAGITPEVGWIFVVDDSCPEESGKFVAAHCIDPRVQIILHEKNMGVGAAVMSGYAAAIAAGADIILKIDGDGQMDPALIPEFVAPILRSEADYTKGNRFYDLRHIGKMPGIRVFGNACLSFLSKISTGYWDLFDPANGYTAIHARVAEHLPFDKISRRYFFETDMLFRLNTLRAVVIDIPMDARYGNEVSNLRISKILPEFLGKHFRNTLKRIFYSYYLRDLSVASFELPLGVLMLGGGTVLGARSWIHSVETLIPTPTGTIMLSVLPIIVGINLLLSFINYDVGSVPRRVIHNRIHRALTSVKSP